jgi:hypothetical protein
MATPRGPSRHGEKVFEPDERLQVLLSNPQSDSGNPEITREPEPSANNGTGIGTIVNDGTDVNQSANNASGTHARVGVGTNPDAANDPVRVYRKAADGVRLLWTGRLNDTGGVSKVLPQDFRKGSTVRLVSRVFTGTGNFWSNVSPVTIE